MSDEPKRKGAQGRDPAGWSSSESPRPEPGRSLRVSRSRPDAERDVSDELSFHLEMRVKELVEGGMSPEEARRQAARSLGDRERVAGAMKRVSGPAARRRRLGMALSELGRDVRLAFRALLRSPGFSVLAIFILALAIGATTAVFSVVNRVLLEALDYPRSERLVQVWQSDLRRDLVEGPVSPVDLADWRRQMAGLESIAGYGYQAVTLVGEDAPVRLTAIETSDSFFDVLGVPPALGRTFLPGEEGPGHTVAVLSHGLWQDRFGADPEIVGRRVRLDHTPYMVVGVMPEGFAFPASAQLWVPFTFDADRLSRGSHFLFAVGRLAPGIALAEAREEATAVAARLEEEYPETNVGQGMTLVPLKEQLVGDVALRLWVLLGAVVLVLLIACGNVGNLLLARTATRGQEIAVRTALGAGRWRLVRQLLTETVVLALVAGAAGIVLAAWGLSLLESAGAGQMVRDIPLDVRILGFALGVSVLTGLVFGLAPAVQLLSRDPAATLASGGARATPGRGAGWLRSALVVAEVAMTLVLLVGAGLLIGNVARLQNVDPGFRAEGVLTARIALPETAYPEPRQQWAFLEEVLARLDGLPGVESFGAVDSLPFSGSRSSSSFDVEGGAPEAEANRNSDVRLVTPGYFRTMGIPLIRGRMLTADDDLDASKAMLVNRAFARRFFGDEEVLGRRIGIGSPQEIALYGEPVWREIVGVVGDLIHDDLTAEPAPEMYLPYAQQPSGRISLALGTTADPVALTDALRQAVLAVDSTQPVYDVATMEERLGRFLSVPRLNARLMAGFSLVALVLAVLGIYSVVSYAVTLRTHELGVRVALGARSADVLRLVLGQGMLRVGVGLVLGLIGALLASGVVRSLLFEASPTDPLTLGGATALLAAVGLVACWLPARRALRVDPIEALRAE